MKEFKKLIRKNYDKILVAVIAAIIGGLVVFVILRLTAGESQLTGGLNLDETLLNPGCDPNDTECRAFRGWYVNKTRIRNLSGMTSNSLLYSDKVDTNERKLAPTNGIVWNFGETNLVAQAGTSFIGSEDVLGSRAVDKSFENVLNWYTASNQMRINKIGNKIITPFISSSLGVPLQPYPGQMLRILICNTDSFNIDWSPPWELIFPIKWVNGAPFGSDFVSQPFLPNTCMPVILLASDGPLPGSSDVELFGFYGDSAYSI